ncbi:MAG: hypothetical protein ACP5FL_06255 [Thermoplasmatota archaeon]
MTPRGRGDSSVPSPPHGRQTKTDVILYAFYRHRQTTPISIREAWETWPETRRVQDSISALRSNIRRLNGHGGPYLLYQIKSSMASVYMLNLRGAKHLKERGLITQKEHAALRKWIIMAIQEEMPSERVNRIIGKTRKGWRGW